MDGIYYILKIAGATLVGVSGLMVGTKLKKRLKNRKELLGEYKSGLEFMESRIVLDELILSDCMTECEKRFCGNFPGYNVFSVFKEKLLQGILSTESSWNEAVAEVSQKGLLKEPETELLISIASTLGKSDIKHHSDKINDVVKKLDLLICETEEKLKKDGSLYVKLGAAISAVVILLLW